MEGQTMLLTCLLAAVTGFTACNNQSSSREAATVVSFHGSLAGVTPDKDLLKAKILVCHGGADKFISAQELAQFRKGLDSIGADYTLNRTPGHYMLSATRLLPG